MFLVFPGFVFAETTANGTGSSVNLGSESSGSGSQLGANEYFLRSDHYGIRLSFYSEDGEKLGKTVDVYDIRWNWGARMKIGFDRVSAEDRWARNHGKTTVDGSLKSRIDYINEYRVYTGKKKNFFKTEENVFYQKYYDRGSVGFSAIIDGKTITTKCKKIGRDGDCIPKTNSSGDTLDAGRLYDNDPLKYLAYSNRDFFKAYFTTESVIKRYSSLTGAGIDTSIGNYYILIEPVFYVSSLTCDANCGYYSITELALIYNRDNSRSKNFKDFFGNGTREKLFWKSLRLQTVGIIGEYEFSVAETYPSASELTDMTFLEKGYGMTIISGKEKCANEHYQIVYRSIDLEKPFVDIKGNIRNLDQNSNWYNSKEIIDKNVYNGSPILTVILTPVDIQAIREENKTINYISLNKNTYSEFCKKHSSIFVE